MHQHRALIIVGLTLAALAASAAAEEPFTVAVMPDTQYYTRAVADRGSKVNIFDQQTRWIADHAEQRNIRFVTHLGDIVSQGRTVQRDRWQVADRAMNKLDGVVPYGVLPGNHDFAPSNTRRHADVYLKYFGESRFRRGPQNELPDWYGWASPDGLNTYQRFEGGGYQFLHLSLAWAPEDAALAWAQRVLDRPRNQGLPTIVSTHQYLNRRGKRAAHHAGEKFDGNTGEQIWRKLIRGNDQIFMVLSGHYTGEAKQVSTNDAGNKVYELLTDYQGRDRGKRGNSGNGWLRLLEFDLANDRINAKTYSPYFDRFERDGDSQFSLTNLHFEERFGSPAPEPEPHTLGLLGGASAGLFMRGCRP